ncbi:hypothetical protein DV738_g2058, partial [Chaetothyriales sp. CBS 135597]
MAVAVSRCRVEVDELEKGVGGAMKPGVRISSNVPTSHQLEDERSVPDPSDHAKQVVRYLETIAEESIKSTRSSAVVTTTHDLYQSYAAPPLDEVHPALRRQPHFSLSSSYSDDLADYSPDDSPPILPQVAMKKPPHNADVSPLSSPGSSFRFGASDTSLVSPIDPSFNIPPHSHQGLYAMQQHEADEQILAGLRNREAAKKSGSPHPADLLDQPTQKVPWKGASGRTALVDPVQNTPAARTGPLLPAQGSDGKGRHARPAAEAVSSARSSSPQTQHFKQQPHTPTTRQRGNTPTSPVMAQHSVYMVPSNADTSLFLPLNPSTPSRTPPAPPADAQPNNSDAQQAMVLQGGENSAKLQQRLRPKFSFEPDSAPTTPVPTIPRKAVNPRAQNPTVAHLQRESESRQSWATYTSTEATDSPVSMAPTVLASSPPPSPLRPLPSPVPVVVRKRVAESVYSSYTGSNASSPSTVSRKPVGSDRHRSASNSSNASKSLPPTPVELQAGDKISSLEARLDDLARRRRNNTKINRELTASLARNGITYDMRKRKEVEKLIATLSLELDDIGREQHEVALTLHRARKKRDRDSCYENPTGLWIRRVTS